ncbi:MAG TPA: Pycsar system effector family protein [Saprospiraceae bacterium]|nr:Pycsar system effector family protein [Saprospiraceae bacterium]
MADQIVDEVEGYVTKLLLQQLSEDHKYHNLSHTLAVRTACRKLGEQMDINEEELQILEIAALFHDVGFIETYNGHEGVSRRIARDFLTGKNYPEDKLERVLTCIDVTFPANRPSNTLEEIIRDADLINLGSDGYATHLNGLRHEWDVFLGQRFTDRDWYKINRKFLKNQSFFTEAAREYYGPKLEDNKKWLKRMDKSAKKRAKGKESPITNSKSAQMMLKTSLRNHIDLSTLADNKANIMLSVNALIITFIVPMAVGQIKETPYLLLPILLLLLTCLISMIFATLATRPIKMAGKTDPMIVDQGKSNLFFFGNFYKMDFDNYKSGIYQVLENEDDLDDSIMRDLFFLGKSLGSKYAQLRVCYTIFMVGVSLAVIAFLAAYSLYA